MNDSSAYRGYRYPPDIIGHAVWLYHRFTLSFRDVEDLLAERGIVVSYESVRQWCGKFGTEYARRIRKSRGTLGDRWYLDEVTVSIQGQRRYLWRAVDQDGDVLDILLQKRKDKCARRGYPSHPCSYRRIIRALCHPLIVMVEPAEHGNRDNLSSRFGNRP